MAKKEKIYKPITTVEIVCTPIVDDNNKVSETNYDLKITNNGYEVIIPINEKVTSLPTNELIDIIDRVLDILNVTEAEVINKNNMPAPPVIYPVPPRGPASPTDPWKEIIQPIITYSTTTSNSTKDELKNK